MVIFSQRKDPRCRIGVGFPYFGNPRVLIVPRVESIKKEKNNQKKEQGGGVKTFYMTIYLFYEKAETFSAQEKGERGNAKTKYFWSERSSM